jgi:hypothetical protein
VNERKVTIGETGDQPREGQRPEWQRERAEVGHVGEAATA